jgi:hypothetical protein
MFPSTEFLIIILKKEKEITENKYSLPVAGFLHLDTEWNPIRADAIK